MKRHIKLTLWSLAILFAALLSLAFTFPGLGFTAIFSFTPLLCLELICRENAVKHSWWYGFAAFLLFNVGASWWIWNVSNVGAVATIILNSLQMGAIYACFRWSVKLIAKQGWRGSAPLPYIFFILMWTGWEHVYFNVELSWPWLVLGNAFATSTRLVQWYEVTGSIGGTLWILTSSALAFSLIVKMKNGGRKAPVVTALCLLVLLPVTASLLRYYNYEESDNPREVVVIQPNIDPFEKYGVIPQSDIDATLIQLVSEKITAHTDYIITPETFTYDLDLDNPGFNPSFNIYTGLLKEHPRVTMLVGALTHQFYPNSAKPTPSARRSSRGWHDVFNSAMTVNREGLIDYYHKSKLVPGVEIIPYQKYLPFLGKIVAACGGSNSSYGVMKHMKPLRSSDSTLLAAMICYESVYGDYSREATRDGAQFMTVMTNDGWWGDTPGYHQHFRYAALRAIENRRDIVQAANTGTSGFIDQRGEIIQHSGWWEATSLRGTVNLNDTLTPFVKYGDVAGKMCGWAFLIALTALIILSFRKKR